MKRKLYILFVMFGALYTHHLEPAACSYGERDMQQQLANAETDLVQLADTNALNMFDRLSSVSVSHQVTLSFLMDSASYFSPCPNRDRQAFYNGIGTSVMLSLVGGVCAYSLKENPHDIIPGIIVPCMPLLLSNARAYCKGSNDHTKDLVRRFDAFRTRVHTAADARKKSSYITILNKRKEGKIAPDMLPGHLAEEEHARLELLENLNNTEQPLQETADILIKLSGFYSVSDFSYAEGALHGCVVSMSAAAGLGFYIAVTELLKQKALTGSFFKLRGF